GSHDGQTNCPREAQDEAAVPPEQRSVPDENRVEVLLRELLANRLEVFLDSHLDGHYGEPAGRSGELRLSPVIWPPSLQWDHGAPLLGTASGRLPSRLRVAWQSRCPT